MSVNKECIIYTIEFNGIPKYIGITSHTLKKRQKEHMSLAFSEKPKYLIHKAIRKYQNNVKFKHIMTAFDWSSACDLEKLLISTLSTYVKNGGYNLTLEGDGCPQPVRSLEWRKKSSLARKGKSFFKGKKHTEETKKKISMSKKGKKRAKYLKRPIIDNKGNEYDSSFDASQILKINRSTISESVRLNRPLRCGLQFFYKEVDHFCHTNSQ